ncbi:MAG: hypothetical protein IJ737_06135 [Ruminococcus sp.]|nr:hypothetical protein [Ruminococcus sp.]
MPSSPVHLRLADIMADELEVKDRGSFLLGSIAPDCVNYGMEQASEEVRYRAHIRDRDYDIWKKKLRAFYQDNKQQFAGSIDYLRGYLFHCWADIAWDEEVQPALFEFLGTLGYGYDDMTGQKWQELYRFNSVVTKAPGYDGYRRLIKAAEPLDIAGCPADLIGKYRDYVADDYRDKITDAEPLFLSERHIEVTAERIREYAGYFSRG